MKLLSELKMRSVLRFCISKVGLSVCKLILWCVASDGWVHIAGEGCRWWGSSGRTTGAVPRSCVCTRPLLNDWEKQRPLTELNGDRGWRSHRSLSTDLPPVATQTSTGRAGYDLRLLIFRICGKWGSDCNSVLSCYHHPVLRKMFSLQRLIGKNSVSVHGKIHCP